MKQDPKQMSVGELIEIIKTISLPRPDRIIEGGRRIVVLQRGWVVVGLYFSQGDECWLEKAAVVRRWGTTNGLPELAEKGPRRETVLEQCTKPIRFHRSAEVLTLDCAEGNWG